MNYILSFCAECGALLPEGLGDQPEELQICPNCATPIIERSNRIEGTFTEEEARRLMEFAQ